MSKPKLGMVVASTEDIERLLPVALIREAEAALGEGYEVVFFVDETIGLITLGEIVNTMTSTYTTFTVGPAVADESMDQYCGMKLTFDYHWRACAPVEPLTDADLADIKAGTFGQERA